MRVRCRFLGHIHDKEVVKGPFMVGSMLSQPNQYCPTTFHNCSMPTVTKRFDWLTN